MAEDLIEHYIDRNSFAGDTKFATDELSKLKASYDSLRKSRANLIETTSTQQTIEETKQWRLEIEKLRAKNIELTNAIKQLRLEALQAAAEKKKQAEADKAHAEDEKRAAGDRRVANVEKIRALKEQQEKQEQLAAIEKQRLEIEKERMDLGPYSIPQGSGQAGPGAMLTNSKVEQFIPQGEQQSSILYLSQLKAALNDNISAQKELEKQLKSGQISQAEFDRGITEAGVKEQEYRALIKQTTAEIRARAEMEMSVQNTIDAARKENALLTRERDQLPVGEMATPEDLERVKELNALIDKNNQLIDENSDALARQKINIGNYPNAFGSAFKTLNAEMTNLEQKLSSGKFQGEELEQLKIRLQALQNAAKMTGQEFKTVNEQQRAYNEAAKQIGLVYGKNSDVFKQFSKEVGTGNKALNDLSKEVSNASTGSKGLAGGLSNVWSAIRRIAYVVPGLGIAGIIGLMLVPLQSLAASIFKANERVSGLGDGFKDLRQRIKDTEGDIEKSSRQFEDAAKNVNELKINIDLAKNGFLDKDKVLRQYNSTIGKTTGEVKTLDDAEQALVKNGDAYIQMMLLKAAANIALGEAAKKAFEAEQLRRKKLDEFLTTGNEIATAIALSGDATINREKLNLEKEKKNKDEQVKLAEDSKQAQLNIAKDFQAQAAQIAKQFDFDFFSGSEDEKKKKERRKKTLEESTRLLDQFHKKNLAAVAEYSRANLLILQGMYQNQMNDQNLSETLRLQSLENYLATSKQLIEKDKKTQEESLLNETANARRDAARIKDARARANVLAEISAYETNQMKVINQKFGNDITKLDQDTANKRWQISADAWQKIRDDAEKSAKFIQQQQELAFKNEQSKVDIDKYNALAELQEQYQSGSIRSIEEYDAKRAQIEQDADNKQKQLQLDRLKQNEAIFEAMYGLQNLDWIKSIKQLEFEINDSANKKILDSDKALLSAQEELRQRRNEMLHESLNALNDFVNSSFDARKQDADQEKKDIEDRAQRQIDLINASTLSEEEKAARTKQINEAAAAQQEQIDRRTAEQQERQAKFNKAIAVMNIGITTAETIAKITASAAAVRATYAIAVPAGVAAGNAIASILMGQIPFVLGSAALQAAAVLAKPIPKFKHGKNTGGYEGPAIVGDGGVSEYIVREDGRIEKTPPRDTLTYIGRHETIFPDFESLIKNTQSKMPSIRHQDNLHPVMETQNKLLRQSLSQLNKIASKRENHITAKDGALVGLWKYGARQSRYIDENTNW